LQSGETGVTVTDRNFVKTKILSYYRTKREYFDKLDHVFEDRGILAYKRGSFDIVSLAHRADAILDVGCGSGTLLHFLRGLYPDKRYYGVDVSPLAVEAASSKISDHSGAMTFAVADAEDYIPFPDIRFDLVIAHEVIEHFVDPARVIRNIADAMKPGGVFFLLAPNRLIRSSMRVKLEKLTDYARMLIDREYLRPTIVDPPLDTIGGDSDAVYVANPFEIHRMVRLAGLQIEKKSLLRCRLIARKPG
jgi:SAM-dependent methyltransferase